MENLLFSLVLLIQPWRPSSAEPPPEPRCPNQTSFDHVTAAGSGRMSKRRTGEAQVLEATSDSSMLANLFVLGEAQEILAEVYKGVSLAQAGPHHVMSSQPGEGDDCDVTKPGCSNPSEQFSDEQVIVGIIEYEQIIELGFMWFLARDVDLNQDAQNASLWGLFGPTADEPQ